MRRGEELTGGVWVTRMSVWGGTLLSQGCVSGVYWKLFALSESIESL